MSKVSKDLTCALSWRTYLLDDLVDLDHLGHSFFLGLWHVGIIVLRLFIDFGDLDFVGFQLDFLDLNLFRFGEKHDKLR